MQRGIIALTMPRDGSIAHHQQAIRLHGQWQVVQHGDDRARAGEAAEQTSQRDLMWRVEVGRGLVEQQHRRFRGECARQQYPLPFAAGEFIQSSMLPGGALGGCERGIDDGSSLAVAAPCLPFCVSGTTNPRNPALHVRYRADNSECFRHYGIQ